MSEKKRFLSVKETADRVGMSRRHLSRVADFPQPIKLNPAAQNGKVVFVESEVNDWICKQIADRREVAA